MASGISVHVGLNKVDPAKYEGWDGALAACEFDAKDMLAIAKKRGFGVNQLLLTRSATVAAVTAAITDAAKVLKSGDIFLLSYAGHGGQVPDKNGDESDRKDETWVLYDRQLVDDELHGLYAKFKAGVRIVVISDSCHSGTVTRAVPPWISGEPRPRFMPTQVGEAVYRAHKKEYDAIQKETRASEKLTLKATVLLVSGCQDNQVSLDGVKNGLFTEKLKKTWNSGKFKFGYRRFRDSIVASMPATQSPNYFVIGPANPAFESQPPFTV